MPFSISKATLPALEISLNALSGMLDKADAYAAAKNVDPAVLLGTRLAPDMFPLLKQVQIATDLAKNGASRLAGVEPPRYEDDEKTISELKTRIAKTVAYLKTVDGKQLDASADRQLLFPLGPSNQGEMNAVDYLNHFLLPNFYFHVTTAYAILRHCGLELGKTDYLAGAPIKVTPR